MPRNNRAWRGVSALVLALLFACSCSGSAKLASSGAVAPAPRSTPSADAYTCASVQALLGHLAAGTVRWSPKTHPFDPAIATQIRDTSVSLQKQLPKVRTVAVLRAVSSSAKAFNEVATAMTMKKRVQVDRAIASTRVAYAKLKRVCGA